MFQLSTPEPIDLDRLLRAPLEDLREFGALPGRNEDPLQLMEGKKSPVAMLARLIEDMVPMIDSFRVAPGQRQRLWERFTGVAFEREITFFHACQQIEGTARRGQDLFRQVEQLRNSLMDEVNATLQHTKWLHGILTLGQLAVSPEFASQRQSAAFANQPDYWPRFARRLDNLNALQTSLQLSVEQFKLADLQAHAVLDRFSEVMTTLVPLWRQRMGFELFAKGLIHTQTS